MAAVGAGLLPLPLPPGPQDGRAGRAEGRRRLARHRRLSGADFPNTDSPGLRVVPKAGAMPVPVPEFDLLAEIDASDELREECGREAEGGE